MKGKAMLLIAALLIYSGGENLETVNEGPSIVETIQDEVTSAAEKIQETFLPSREDTVARFEADSEELKGRYEEQQKRAGKMPEAFREELKPILDAIEKDLTVLNKKLDFVKDSENGFNEEKDGIEALIKSLKDRLFETKLRFTEERQVYQHYVNVRLNEIDWRLDRVRISLNRSEGERRRELETLLEKLALKRTAIVTKTTDIWHEDKWETLKPQLEDMIREIEKETEPFIE